MAARIQAVDRALRILEALAEAQSPMNLTEISRRAGLHASTTHRLLATMSARGFVERDHHTGSYRVGVQAFRVGSSFPLSLDLHPRLRVLLMGLASRSGETSNLVVMNGLEAVYIDHVVGTKVAKLYTQIGQGVPLHCTAVGKVLLAYTVPGADETFPVRLKLTRFTPHTITNPRALIRELAIIRASGCAVDREEHELGVACIAAPVRDASSAVVATIGISGPSRRVLAREPALAKAVRQCAREASLLLGRGTSDPPGYRPLTHKRPEARSLEAPLGSTGW